MPQLAVVFPFVKWGVGPASIQTRGSVRHYGKSAESQWRKVREIALLYTRPDRHCVLVVSVVVVVVTGPGTVDFFVVVVVLLLEVVVIGAVQAESETRTRARQGRISFFMDWNVEGSGFVIMQGHGYTNGWPPYYGVLPAPRRRETGRWHLPRAIRRNPV